MRTFIRFYSNKKNEIHQFLHRFYPHKTLENLDASSLEYEIIFENPIEMTDLIRLLY